MRRDITIARTFLFLSIVKFALAAPVEVREVHEVHLNVVDVAEGGTATPQKRWDSGPWDDHLANAAHQTSGPTIPQFPYMDHSGLYSSRSSTKSNNAPSSSALSTGPHPRPRAGTPPPSSPPASAWPSNYPSSPEPIPGDISESSWESKGYYSPITLSDYSGKSSPPPSTPSWLAAENPHPPSPQPSSESSSTDNSPNRVSEPVSSLDYYYYPPSSSSTGPHQSLDEHSISSSEPPRPPEPKTQDFIGRLGLTEGQSNPSNPSDSAEASANDLHNQLAPPPRPTVPETTNFLSQISSESAGPSTVADLEHETKDVLGQFLKGKIKRRISGSAVNSAQE